MKSISDRLTIETYNGKQIICVDYSGLKVKDMVELDIKHLEVTLETRLPFLADYQNTYVTKEYLQQAREFIELTKEIIDKGAFLGIDKIKSFILKRICLQYGVNYQAFETREEAIKFLVGNVD